MCEDKDKKYYPRIVDFPWDANPISFDFRAIGIIAIDNPDDYLPGRVWVMASGTIERKRRWFEWRPDDPRAQVCRARTLSVLEDMMGDETEMFFEQYSTDIEWTLCRVYAVHPERQNERFPSDLWDQIKLTQTRTDQVRDMYNQGLITIKEMDHKIIDVIGMDLGETHSQRVERHLRERKVDDNGS